METVDKRSKERKMSSLKGKEEKRGMKKKKKMGKLRKNEEVTVGEGGKSELMISKKHVSNIMKKDLEDKSKNKMRTKNDRR